MTETQQQTAAVVCRQIGEQIRRRRVALRMSQDDLADAIGPSKSSLRRIEEGVLRMRLDYLAEIASVLRTDLRSLLLDALDLELEAEDLAEVRGEQLAAGRGRSGKRSGRKISAR